MNEDTDQMITDCENRESKLTDWERGFIDSVRNSVDAGSGINQNQQDKLDEIWERVTA